MTDHGLVARASVRVSVDPERAFEIFTGDIGSWWKRGTNYWNDAERGIRVVMEQGVGGRLYELYSDGDTFEIGVVTEWLAGRLLAFTWSQSNWAEGDTSTVTIRFAADGDGTLVSLEHSGWETLADPTASASGYSAGWGELLGMYLLAIGD